MDAKAVKVWFDKERFMKVKKKPSIECEGGEEELCTQACRSRETYPRLEVYYHVKNKHK